MANAKDIVDYSLIAMGTTVSIPNIESILGIIMLSIQGIWLLIKLGFKVADYIKNKKNLQELDKDVSEVIDIVEDVVDLITPDKKDGDNTNE